MISYLNYVFRFLGVLLAIFAGATPPAVTAADPPRTSVKFVIIVNEFEPPEFARAILTDKYEDFGTVVVIGRGEKKDERVYRQKVKQVIRIPDLRTDFTSSGQFVEIGRCLAALTTAVEAFPQLRAQLLPLGAEMKTIVDSGAAGLVRRSGVWTKSEMSETSAPSTLVLRDLSGREYRNAEITREEPDGLMVKHEGGISKVLFVSLPKEIQYKYKFDPIKAEKYRKDTLSMGGSTPTEQTEDKGDDDLGAKGENLGNASLGMGQIDDGSSLLKKQQQVEEASTQSISKFEAEISASKNESQKSEAAFNAAGGERSLKAIRQEAGRYWEFSVRKVLVDPTLKGLGGHGENVYEVIFIKDGGWAIVVTKKELASGQRAGLNLKLREKIEVTLVDGGKDAREVYVETPPLNHENPPEIVKLYDEWQTQLDKIEELSEAVKRVEDRQEKAIEILRTAGELIGSIRVPELIVSPRLVREGFTAAIQDRKFNDVTEALKTGSLVKIEASIKSSPSNESKFETIDNFSPTDEKDLPKIDDLKRLFADLVNQDFRVELVTADARNVTENRDRQRHAFQERSYVYIPYPVDHLKKLDARAGGGLTGHFVERGWCDVDEILNSEILANNMGYIKDVQIFSCSAIAFSYSTRPGLPNAEPVQLYEENQQLLEARDQKSEAAEQDFESGRIEKDAFDNSAALAQAEYVSRFKALLSKY